MNYEIKQEDKRTVAGFHLVGPWEQTVKKGFEQLMMWVDSKNSDFYSVHSYTIPARKRHDKHYARPYFLSETGGISLKVKDHSYFDGFFGHGKAKTFEALNKKYFKLYKNLYKQLKKGKLNGIIYTEVSDCEKEYNGIYTFDREVLKLDKEKLIELNKKI